MQLFFVDSETQEILTEIEKPEHIPAVGSDIKIHWEPDDGESLDRAATVVKVRHEYHCDTTGDYHTAYVLLGRRTT